jgi:alpha-L-fucosidase
MFKEAGAGFAGPVAEHHDGFSMWDSKVNRWNAKNMGPKRDIVGEMEKAVRKQNMKFITTFHHAHNWYHYYHSKEYDTGNPEYSDLYGPIHDLDSRLARIGLKSDRPNKEFCDRWLAKIKEVVDNYKPDMIWFDFCLKFIPDSYKRKMTAYYYNKGEEWNKEVEIMYKDFNLVPGVGLLDYERGRSSDMTHYKWITDTTLGNKSWSYVENEEYKPMDSIVHNFINNITRNGYLLMNFGPKANGEIPEEMRIRFKELGKWLKTNQEAVFNATPWVVSDEGPTLPKKTGGFSENKEVQYTAKDLRFISNEKSLFVFMLGWPGSEMVIRTLVKNPKMQQKWVWMMGYHGGERLKRRLKVKDLYLIEESDIASVELVGINQKLTWQLTSEGLKVQLPSKKPCDYAYTLKITWTE